MRAAAEILVRPVTAPRERGGILGLVLPIVCESPGITTREIVELLKASHPEPAEWRPGPSLSERVSGALNKLKLEGEITPRQFREWPYRWIPGAGPHAHGYTAPPVEPLASETTKPGGPEVFCPCGMSILFGALASDAERAEPRCSRHPFACRGAA